jgi:putative spermidine/putrescine transport system substrate-binding protein/spermidine/putrescine transport system substrate-binding protein
MNTSAKKLRILTWEGFIPDWLISGFLQESGIYLEVDYAGTNDEVIERLTPAGESGYDLTTVDHHASVELVQHRLIDTLDTENLPAFRTNFEAFQKSWYTYIDGQIWGLPFAWGSMALVYNPSKVSEDQASTWNCMWDKQLSGQLAQYDSPIEAIFGAAIINGHTNVFTLDRDQLEDCKNRLIEQKKLLKGAYDSIQTVADWFEEGSLAIAHTWMAAVTELTMRGIPVEISIPKEGCLAGVLLYHTVKEAPNPQDTYKFINYATRPDVCARLCCEISNSPCNKLVIEHLDEQCKHRLSTNPRDIERFILYQPVENYDQYVNTWDQVKEA